MPDVQKRWDPWLIYEEWMEKEGIPIYKGVGGVEDLTELPRGPWARLGGKGTFVVLEGMKYQGGTGDHPESPSLLYVAEIPGGGALAPEKHLCDELIYILRGRGLAEVWQEGKEKAKRSFEWGEGSMFAPPLNAWHRLVNGGRQPAVFVALSRAPRVMEEFRSIDFVFNCDYKFTDRYSGQSDYFLATEKRFKAGARPVWETNFVPDMRIALLDDMPQKVAGGQITWFRMAGGTGMHASTWPAGKYHKAHFHGPGAVLLGLQSEGYALMWPREYGPHPFQDGHADKVIKKNWKPGGIYNSGAGPGLWFHQHFNTGPEEARHLALGDPGGSDVVWRGGLSVREGGRVVEYADEDPEIRRMFLEELRKKGVKNTMEPVVYNTAPLDRALSY